ncbi:Beige/BEACH domain containing protein [Trichomonas vaginalis G3]|uniref:Beige/BEACH domain containing protein n=1 Tax=Trichomonas vaginalis (strain ATCC PRA-98 / G3) TaxID=412133 RepID=A2E9C8_TRIV3|nr:aggrephagy protein [Trichomonas vaginalis G3]EAY10692.1 Beige/BEACH domain containing protein [Trichomonas vaginalis G3]KAI5538585.1 aggrephagy protein [Trichomonas vaginalis G3]|eukprot:XP_001322915.1 Beige/BEACH domain containing protein [Trichomonas vaginalis G3]
MKGWFSNKFERGENDNHQTERVIYRDKLILQYTNEVLQSYIPNTPKSINIKVLLQVSSRINYIIANVKTENKPKSKELDVIVDLINPLFDSLQILLSKSNEIQIILNCIYNITFMLEIPPEINNVSNSISALIILYSIKSENAELIDRILVLYLRSRQFIQELANVDFFSFIISSLFTKDTYVSGLVWFIGQFSVFTRNINFSYSELASITLIFISCISQGEIPSNNIGFAIKFFVSFSKLFRDPDPISYFLNNSGITILSKHCNKEMFSLCLATLVYMSDTEKNQILDFIKANYMQNNDRMIYAEAFKILFMNEDSNISYIDKYWNILDIFCVDIDNSQLVKCLVDCLLWISYRKYEKCLQFSILFFKFIDKEFVETKTQTLFFDLLIFSIDRSNFESISDEILNFLKEAQNFDNLLQIQSFQGLIKHLYCIADKTQFKVQIIVILFLRNASSELIGRTFALEISINTMQEVMQIMQKRFNDKIEILYFAFQASQECASIFWRYGGFAWLDVFPSIDPELYSKLLKVSLNNLSEKDANNWVQSIPLTHKLLKMDSSLLNELCITENRIRIPSLLPFAKSDINFANADLYLASEDGVTSFIKLGIYESPLLDKMANLNLNYGNFVNLLENHKDLSRMIDENISFPMFEFRGGMKSFISIQKKCLGFSFWMKSDRDKLFCEIFSSKSVRGELVSGLFTFFVNEESFHIQIDNKKWFLVTFQLNLTENSAIFGINDLVQIVHMKGHIDCLDDLVIGSKERENTNFWYISSQISLFSENFDVKDVFRRGFNYLDGSKTDFITPFDTDLVLKDVVLMKGTGFPWFLSQQCNIYRLFNLIMENKNTEMYFNAMVKLFVTFHDLDIELLLIPMKKFDFSEEILSNLFEKVLLLNKINVFLEDIEIVQKYGVTLFRVLSKYTDTQTVFKSIPVSIQMFSDIYIVEDICEIARRSKSLDLYKTILSYFKVCDDSTKVRILSVLDLNSVSKNVFTPFEISLQIMNSSDIVNQRLINVLIDFNAMFDDYFVHNDIVSFALFKSYNEMTTFKSLECLLMGKTFENCGNLTKIERPETVASVISFLFQCLTVLVSSPPKSLQIFEEKTFIFIRRFTKLPKAEFDSLCDIRVLDSIVFFSQFVFDPKAVLKVSTASITDDKSILKEISGVFYVDISYVNKSGRTSSINYVSYADLLIGFMTKNGLEGTFYEHKNVESINLFAKSSDLINLYSQILASFMADENAFKKSFISLLAQHGSRQEILVGDLALNVIVVILARVETYSAPLGVFVELFDFLAVATYNGYFTDLCLLFSSLLPILGSLYQSPHLTLLSSDERTLNSLRSILIHIFEVSLDDVPQLFDIVNSISHFLFKNSGLFDFDFSCQFLFKLIQHPMVKEYYIKQTTELSIKYLMNEEFRQIWQTKTDIPIENFISGIKSNLKGKITKNFTDTLAFLAEYTTRIEPYTPCSAAHHLTEDQITTNLSLSYVYLMKYRNYTDMYLKQIINLAKSNLLRKMEQQSSKIWHFLHKFELQTENYNYFTISPLVWPIETPHILVPSDLSLPSGENDIEKYKLDVETNETNLIKNYQDLSNCFYIEMKGKFVNPLNYRFAVIPNGQFLYNSFAATYSEKYGNVSYSFPCKLRRMPEQQNSVTFVFENHFLVLINSKIVDNFDLELTKTEAPINFRSLSNDILLGFYGEFSLFCGHFVLIFPFKKIIFSKMHMNLHKLTAIEFKLYNTGTLIISPVDNQKLPDSFVKEILVSKNINFGTKKLFQLNSSSALSLWQSGMLSTYDYLLVINSLGSRSFADLTQYPVFPWIISDYDSDDCGHFTSHRKINLPMGQQTEERSKMFDSTFNGQFLYGAHYSMGASVHFFLLRTPPFTFYDWDLHTGYDNLSRIFFDIKYSWQSSSELNTNDVKELIPELFSLPELFLNVCNLNLIEEVKLPKWCKSAVHFILVNREELNEASIGQWIDLIFGVSQQGQLATQSKNIFLPESYHSYIDTIREDDIDEISTLALRLEHWGQCPIQLFKKNHQERNFNPKKVSLEFEKMTNEFSNLNYLVIDSSNYSLCYGNFVYRNTLFSGVNFYNYSSDGALLVVDFIYGFSSAYLLCYSKANKMTQIIQLGVFNSSDISKSFPCSRSMMVCSVRKNSVVVWDAIRGSFHREIKVNEKIVGISLDEQLDLMWITTNSSMRIYTLNGIFVCQKKFDSFIGRITNVSSYNIGQCFFNVVVSENTKICIFELDSRSLSLNLKTQFKMDNPISRIIDVFEKQVLIIQDITGEKFVLRLSNKGKGKN